MDILYWNNLNPNVQYYNTSKQFFRQYLWRLAIEVPGGRLLNRNKKESLEKAIEHRQHADKLYLSHTSFWKKRRPQVVPYDIELLLSIEKIRENFADKILIRIEEPHIQFYADDEKILKAISSCLSTTKCIKDVTGPSNVNEADILKTGAILTHTSPDYNYKIVLRDGRYTTTVKQQLLSYLDSLGEEIKLTRGCREMLNKTYPSMWNVYFYAKDPGICTFIGLIDPNLVSNIHELVNVDYK